MLNVSFGKKRPFCDHLSRRDLLQIGGGLLGGLALPSLLQAESAVRTSHKALINIHLAGGPSHQDMFDLKPDAPVEFRGEFNPISTNLPGIEICELFPRLAQMADKYSIIRSLVGMIEDHSDHHTQTGFNRESLRNVGGRPSIGSIASRLLGTSGTGAPAFVSYNGAYPGYLGAVYKPYHPQGGDLRLNGALTAGRMSNRTELLASLDNIRRDVDSSGQMKALDAYTRRAVDVVTSGRVADALDLNKEEKGVRERYSPQGEMFLTARRLVEAGVRVVTLNWGSWDTHGNNFGHLRTQLPQLDRGLSALLQDLYDRGLYDDVSIVMWGEFGRTPRVNAQAGRDHWSRVSMGFVAGGGMKMGQVIGSSSRYAEDAKDRPVDLQEVFATLYHAMGINVESTTILDPNGRPQYLVEKRNVIRELVG